MATPRKANPKKAGRPSDYNEGIADAICRRIVEGRAISDVCSDDDMPNNATVYDWRRRYPEFDDKIARAREERLEAYARRMHDIGARVLETDGLDPQRANAAVNAIDKAARLQMPKTSRVELTGKDGGAVKTETLTSPTEAVRLIAFALRKAAEDDAV